MDQQESACWQQKAGVGGEGGAGVKEGVRHTEHTWGASLPTFMVCVSCKVWRDVEGVGGGGGGVGSGEVGDGVGWGGVGSGGVGVGGEGIKERTDLRSLLGVIIEGVTNLPVLGSGNGLLHKLIIDAFMDKGAGPSCAALPLQHPVKIY